MTTVIGPGDPTKVPLSTVTTAGDLIVGSGASAVSRLGVGSNGQVLEVVSGSPAWTTPSAGYPNVQTAVLASAYTLTTTTTAFLTSPSLATGTWLVIVQLSVDINAASNTWIPFALAAGSASATISAGSGEWSLSLASVGQIATQTLMGIVTVTAAGTITVTASINNQGGSSYITTGTMLSAIKIA